MLYKEPEVWLTHSQDGDHEACQDRQEHGDLPQPGNGIVIVIRVLLKDVHIEAEVGMCDESEPHETVDEDVAKLLGDKDFADLIGNALSPKAGDG